MINIKIKEIAEGFTPVYKHEMDACCDCKANVDKVVIPRKKTMIIPLGFAVEIPNGWEGIIKGRSGLSSKGIVCQIGCIDSNYRGEVGVILTNLSENDFVINRGDRVCQFKVQEAVKINFEKVKELTDTDRGESGFGSSGI